MEKRSFPLAILLMLAALGSACAQTQLPITGGSVTLPASPAAAGTYICPSSITINATGDITGIVAGTCGAGGSPWKTSALPTSPSPYPVTAADLYIDRTWDGGAGSAVESVLLPMPSTLAANFATNFTVYSGTVILGKVSGATFTFKGAYNGGQTPTLVAGDSAWVRVDDKGNWAVSVSNSIDAPHP